MKRKLFPKQLLIFCSLLISVTSLYAQQSISGVVISGDERIPLSGVSVTAQGASSGTVTDNNGRFKITVPSATTQLSFSYTGYLLQTVDINNKSVFSIELNKDPKQLGEVI